MCWKIFQKDRMVNIKENMHSFFLAEKLPFPLSRLFTNRVMSFVTEPMMIVSSQLDLIKDLLLVMRVITGLGWFYVVFTNPRLFSSNVSYFKLFAL